MSKMETRNFYNMRMAVADLTLSSVRLIDLDPELLRANIGGAAVNRTLLDLYESSSLVLGTGPLTGSFAPASALLAATFLSPRESGLRHVPLLLRTGPEMKFAGLDFLVIRGAAAEPSVLHVSGRAVRILPAPDPALPIPEVLSRLRAASPAFRASILAGPAAFSGSPHAAASLGSRGSLDKGGLAHRMAMKNLAGVLFSGDGGLPFRSDHPDRGRALQERLSAGRSAKEKGFAGVLRRLPGGSNAVKALGRAVKGHAACYHCPFPCMSHASFEWREEKERRRSGVSLSDPLGWIALSDRWDKESLPLLRRCLDLGLEPVSVHERLSREGSLEERLRELENLAAEPDRGEKKEGRGKTDGDGDRMKVLFGGGIAPLLEGEDWARRVSQAMVLGVCPVFLLRFPSIGSTDLLSFLDEDEEASRQMEGMMDEAITVLSGADPVP
jgi:aldehyde:ferredoxin oxidoreductase